MKRRALLLAGLACSSWAKAATPPSMSDMGRLYRSMQADVRQGMGLMRQRQWMQAVLLFQSAQAKLDAEPQDGWPLRVYVLPLLGACLLALQQYTQARAVLDQAQDAEARIAAGEAGPQVAQVLTSLNQRAVQELMNNEFKRQLLGDVETRTEAGGLPIDDLLHDVRIGAHSAEMPLARALAQLGLSQPLQAMYNGSPWPTPGPQAAGDGWSPNFMGDEYRSAQYSMALMTVGCSVLAAKAISHALSLNWVRCVQFGSFVPSVQSHAGAFGMRRLLLGVGLGLWFEQADAHPALPKEWLIARLLESKGLGLRHGAQLRRLMATSTQPQVRQAHELMRQQEARLHADLARDLTLPEFMASQVSTSGALAQALPLLREQGLAEVFVPGERLLQGLRSLPKNTACVGFACYRPQAANGRSLAPTRYARWTWINNTVSLQDIGPSQAIDTDIVKLRTLLTGATQADGAALQRLQASLQTQLLSELPDDVTQAKRWYIEPDGALSLLPFELLSDARGQLLIDQCCISVVTSFAQVLQTSQEAASGPACVVANPAYPQPSDSGPLRGRITALPETAKEAQAVKAALSKMGQDVRVYEGKAATTAALRFENAPRTLHVAAHGLMLDTALPDAMSGAGQDSLSVVLPGRGSALALSGENGVELMHGTDLMALNLRGTALAVLSACDTSNGHIQNGEGLDSLRRALETAGVQATVTSLWPVPSQATVLLMTEFYQALAAGQGVAQALRQAKLKARKVYPQAQAWAGFVAAGKA
jgi:CHAT domain-containing protein